MAERCVEREPMWECVPVWPVWPGVASGIPWVVSAGPVPVLPAFPGETWASTGVAASSVAAQAAVSRRAFAMVLSFLLRQRFTLAIPRTWYGMPSLAINLTCVRTFFCSCDATLHGL